MMDIKYELSFFEYWHCGSGLSSGADLDLLVIKDKDGLPYVPGKTIKGLLREAVEELIKFKTYTVDENSIVKAFGDSPKRKSSNENEDEEDKHGSCFFKNAELEKTLRENIINEKLNKYFYKDIASTEINDNGVAEENSLRRMEVTIPCTLEGEILDIPDVLEELMSDGMSFIKRLGQNRNRGLGRCIFQIKEIIKKEEGQA